SSSSLVPDAPPTSELYPLSLHDALPILLLAKNSPLGDQAIAKTSELCALQSWIRACVVESTIRMEPSWEPLARMVPVGAQVIERSEEHTSELQSREKLVCRLLLEKKKRP